MNKKKFILLNHINPVFNHNHNPTHMQCENWFGANWFFVIYIWLFYFYRYKTWNFILKRKNDGSKLNNKRKILVKFFLFLFFCYYLKMLLNDDFGNGDDTNSQFNIVSTSFFYISDISDFFFRGWFLFWRKKLNQ